MNLKNRKTLSVILTLLASAFMSASSWASDYDIHVTPYSSTDGKILVSWDIPECTSDNPNWDDKSFQFKYKKKGALLWTKKINATNLGVVFYNNELEPLEEYKFEVKYYGKNSNCRGFTKKRELASKTYRYDPVISPNNDIGSGLAKKEKIRSVTFDKCMYPYTWAGGKLSSVRVNHWDCFNEPAKAFTIEYTGFYHKVKMKSATFKQCIVPTINSETGLGSCKSAASTYLIEPIYSNNKPPFRLRHMSSGQCLYTSSGDNGAKIRHMSCSFDDRQHFEFVDY